MRNWMLVGLCAAAIAVVGFAVVGCGESAPEDEQAQPLTPAAVLPRDSESSGREAGQVPRAEVASTGMPPTIDGVLDDAAWKGKRLKGAMLNVYTSEVAKVQSGIFVTCDDKNIYVAFDMPELRVGDMVAAQTDPVADRDGNIWEDDSVEIFLDPADGKEGPIYYHVAVNFKGVVYDAHVKESAWNSHVAVAARVGKDRWTVEVAIPLSDMGVKNSLRGKTWLANFCRNRQVTGATEDTSWADVGEEFHNWEAYGHITFK